MTTAVSSRDRKVLAFGIASIGLLVGAAKGLPRLREMDRTRTAATLEAIHEAGTLDAATRSVRAMTDSARARDTRADRAMERLVLAASPQAAAVSLASTLGGYAREAHVRLVSASVRSDSAFAGAFATIGVRISIIADVEGMSDLLRRVEGGALLLAVRELNVSQPEPASPGDRPEMLHAELLIEALATNGTKRPPMTGAP